MKFVAWTPDRLLELCEGDCDSDDDCDGDDTVCFQRNGQEDSHEVPGCSNPDGVAFNLDVCTKKSLVEVAARRERQG
jgi:hypothetical protein